MLTAVSAYLERDKEASRLCLIDSYQTSIRCCLAGVVTSDLLTPGADPEGGGVRVTVT